MQGFHEIMTGMSKSPVNAVVLAAGVGTRLRPLTWVRPKPLVPVWGQPLILHIVAMLERWGVTDIHINLHWQADQMRHAFADYAGQARLHFYFETEILGTGGALRPMQAALAESPFWLVNSDIVASVDPKPLIRALSRHADVVAAAWLEPRKGPRTVETGEDGRITSYRSSTPGASGTATFCGLHVVSPRIFDFFPKKPVFSIVEAYERAASAGYPVSGVCVRGSFWDDAGTVDRYLRIHDEVRRRHRQGRAGGHYYDALHDANPNLLKGFCCAPQSSLVSATVRQSVLWPGARLEAGASLTRTVLSDQAVAGGCWRDVALIPVSAAPEPELASIVTQLGWPIHETALSLLGVRGSNRTFWRAGCGRKRAILVQYSLERSENARYAGHARLLAEAGVPVPRVLADDATRRIMALEDWGDLSLETRMQRHPEDAEPLYKTVLAAVAGLHGAATHLAQERSLDMEPAFDHAIYQWEHNLFQEHLLVRRYGWAHADAGVGAELERVAKNLLHAPRVIVHRDLQSSNILWRGNRFVLIDFQGMRLGAAAYDLASLLCDPYVRLQPEMRQRLLSHYALLCPGQGEAAVDLFAWAAVQRLVQALGAYGRLAGLGYARFASFIVPAAGTLAEMASHCGLRALAGLMNEIACCEKTRMRENRA